MKLEKIPGWAEPGHMRTLKVIGIGILLLAGCGSDGVTIENFAQKYAEAICSKNFQCCGASELADKTMSTCVTNNQLLIGALTASINESKAKGRANYDAAKSGTCIDSLKAMTCDQFKQGISANMAACMAFVTPNVAQGGACTQDYECTTGNCAGADTSVDPPVDGMCGEAITLVPIGGTCGGSGACVDGAYCETATTTCQPHKAAGTACTSDDECVNECDTATNTCTCYSGCDIGAATTARGTALSVLLLGAGLLVRRSRRRRRANG
jgi:hypothetical protein